MKPPRVAQSPAALECRLLQVVSPAQLSGEPAGCHIVIGQVVGLYVDDRFLKDGRLDTAGMRPLARMGYDEYSAVERAFAITRPAGGGNFDEAKKAERLPDAMAGLDPAAHVLVTRKQTWIAGPGPARHD